MSYTCKRCNHKWIPRTEEKPKCCPACKTYRYDTPKGEKKEATK